MQPLNFPSATGQPVPQALNFPTPTLQSVNFTANAEDDQSDNDDDETESATKKKSGRAKKGGKGGRIPIEPIEDKGRRTATFSRRKDSMMKKVNTHSST